MVFASTPQVKHALFFFASILYATNPSMQHMEEEFDLKRLGGRVAYALAKAGISVAHAARELEITRPAIDQWIDGRTLNIKNELLFKLADITGHSARWIATGTGPRIDRYSNSKTQALLNAFEPLPDFAKDKAVSEVQTLAYILKRAEKADPN